VIAMMANVYSEIDLNKGIPSLESFKENLESFVLDIHLEPEEFVCLFKEYIRSNLDIDLDELNILTILDIKSQRIVLDTEYLEENDPNELFLLIDEFKHHFGRSVFTIRTSVNISTIVRKVLANCSSYVWNEDGSINICYSLLDITQTEIGQYLTINN
jgi:hypothetical protein